MSVRTSCSSYIIKFKLSVSKYTKENGNHVTPCKFSLLETNVWKWKEQEKLHVTTYDCHSFHSKKMKFPEIGNQLIKFLNKKIRLFVLLLKLYRLRSEESLVLILIICNFMPVLVGAYSFFADTGFQFKYKLLWHNLYHMSMKFFKFH